MAKITIDKTKPVKKIAEALVKDLEPFTQRIEIAGSIRRKVSKPNDIDIVLIPKDEQSWEEIREFLADHGSILRHGKWIIFADVAGVEINIWKTLPQSWGATMFFATGPSGYGIAYRMKARHKGMILNQYGLFDLETKQGVAGETEESIFEILRPEGYKEPEERGK